MRVTCDIFFLITLQNMLNTSLDCLGVSGPDSRWPIALSAMTP
jgi:hypothetical protein